MFKVIVQVEGIKRKEKVTKIHSFTLSQGVSSYDLNDLEDRARDMVESNMKTSNKAVLMLYRTRIKEDENIIEVDKLPIRIKEIRLRG